MARIDIKREGIRQLLVDPLTGSAVLSVAHRIASSAGPGMKVTPLERSGVRVRAAVVTATVQARLAEARNRALTRAVGNG